MCVDSTSHSTYIKITEKVATICIIVTTILSILTYRNNSKIQHIELKIKELEYKQLKQKSRNNK